MTIWLIGWWLAMAVATAPSTAIADADAVADAADATPRDKSSRRAWVHHVMHRAETLDDVAERYGVTSEELRAANGLSAKAEVETGTVLRIHATKFPRPRQQVRLSVGKKDTWEEVAQRYDLSVAELKQANLRFAKRRRPGGLRLHAWMDTRVLPPGSGQHGAVPPQFEVRTDGLSVGRPHRGRLEDGVALPESDQYTIRKPRQAYGTSLAVVSIQRAVATFRYQTGFEGEVMIGAMSRRTGRRLRPHRSHQSGRDADIRLPAMAFAEGEHDLSVQDVDWPAAWGLIRAFVAAEVVQVIFLERRHFRRLRRAGREMGATDEEIEQVMSRLRHAKGHTAHFHVRFICSPLADRCRD